jgi:hypothetical protein
VPDPTGDGPEVDAGAFSRVVVQLASRAGAGVKNGSAFLQFKGQ